MRNKMIELIEEGQHEFLEMQTNDNDPQDWDMRTSSEVITDHLVANWVTIQELALPKEDYYVLRNQETGMYFRGKGGNRWGKNFNQATIYRAKGTAEHSIKDVAWHGEKAELVRIKIVELPEPPKEEA